MKVKAVIFAGGVGARMNLKNKPKQFLEYLGKPIIIYTLENFELNKQIDEIVVVCLESWIDYLKSLLIKFNIKKVVKVVPGGSNGQESIYNGLNALYEKDDDTIVLIHDGVRPLIDTETIDNNIAMVKKNGTSITVSPAIETIVQLESNQKIKKITDRKTCMMARAPQSFYLKDIYAAHKKALEENMKDFIDSATMMKHYGYDLFSVEGPAENIKITTPSDFYVFKACVEAKLDSEVFG